MTETLLAALLWDAVFGYPERLFRRIGHPVSWIGRLIAAAESRLNRSALKAGRRGLHGVFLVIGVVAVSAGTAMAVQAVLEPLAYGWMLETLLAASLLSGRSLYRHVRAVGTTMRADGLKEARSAVSRIVGREVGGLDRSGVCRAAIESLAENFSDGLVGPAAAYLVGGLPGIAVYKAVNTADSMIGHRCSRYREFGWAAARLDDLLNLVPARLSSFLIAAGTPRRFLAALKTSLRDAGKHSSPNSGWPEAAMAGVLGRRLGGPRRYDREAVKGAWLGEGPETAGPEDIDRALGAYLRAALWIGVILAAAGAFAFFSDGGSAPFVLFDGMEAA